MISFGSMKAEEFPDYRAYFIDDYAREIAANFGYTMTKSREIAAKELADDLPQDVSTADNILLCIENGFEQTIGYLWYKLFDNGETVFVLDFVLFEHFRGMGYGQAALIALQEQLSQTGVEQIKLRVAFDNQRARYLYDKLGFKITGYNMMKILER